MMLQDLILPAALATLIVALTYMVKQRKRKTSYSTTIPGPAQSDLKLGSFPDIEKAGSLHAYLADLHNKYGPIVKFWWGPKLALSICTPVLMKEHIKMFDRPVDLYTFLLPIMGENNVGLCKGEEGRRRLAEYSKCFSSEAMRHYVDMLKELSNEFVSKWESLKKDEHILLVDHCFEFAIKAILRACMGDFFCDDAKATLMHQSYNSVFEELEKAWRNNDQFDETEEFRKGLETMLGIGGECVAHRKRHPATGGEYLLIDAVMELDLSDTTSLYDFVMFVTAGFHTSGLLTTWALYFLARHPDIQEKVHREIVDVLGDNEIDEENILELVYMQQVLDETLRNAAIGPIAAREQEVDGELGGHKVAAGTPVVHALGVMHLDPELYPDPLRFDPDRFSEANVKTRHPLSFEPFGFAGKRKCPGYRFSLHESKVLLVAILRTFVVSLVKDEDIGRKFGFVTFPDRDVFVTVRKRT